jgi:hypothetical protein
VSFEKYFAATNKNEECCVGDRRKRIINTPIPFFVTMGSEKENNREHGDAGNSTARAL